MDYILKQFDEPLAKFSATTDTSEPEIQILWTNEEKAALLPLDLTLTPEGLKSEIDAALAAQERYDVSHLHALAEENEQIARKLMEEA